MFIELAAELGVAGPAALFFSKPNFPSPSKLPLDSMNG